MAEYTKAQLTEMIVGKLQRNFGRTVEEATDTHMFKACALVLRDIMSRRQMATSNHVWEGQKRQVHYLSLEFLMGRSLEKNAYNLISFQTDTYTDIAKLKIYPKPDTLIRVFMAWKCLEKPIQIEPQQFGVPTRKGFTVVEWGGSFAG